MNRGKNIFDFLEDNRIAYHASAPEATEEENLNSALRAIESGSPDFAFVYWPGLDALLHRTGNQSPRIGEKLRGYEDWIERLLEAARQRNKEVRLYVFSDHGMANCEEILDLRAKIESLPLTAGKDYAVVYDSTMARFWFFSDRARNLITSRLELIPQGRIISKEELVRLGAYFPDGYFGEVIFLVKEGVLIVPSDMGERPLTGMHGYHPDDKHSHAMICTNQNGVPDEIASIPDFYKLMVLEASMAKQLNAGGVRSAGITGEEAMVAGCATAK
jgi:predicted AlkP superfamily pyrophosphatase or phosphodiesterase